VDGFEHSYRAPGKHQLPLLEGIRIAAPCEVSWDAMDGNGRVRECGDCKKQVFNLSAMSRADAEVLIRERVGDMCVRLYRREDGTVLTSDCPVGVRRRLTTRALVSMATTALLGAFAFLGLSARKRPELSSRPSAGYAAHDGTETLTTASMLVMQNEARLAAEEAAKPKPPAAGSGGRPGGHHTMGMMCNVHRTDSKRPTY
jgi:hypothetical protein